MFRHPQNTSHISLNLFPYFLDDVAYHHHIIACCVELADLKSNNLLPAKTALCQVNATIIVQRINQPLLVGIRSNQQCNTFERSLAVRAAHIFCVI